MSEAPGGIIDARDPRSIDAEDEEGMCDGFSFRFLAPAAWQTPPHRWADPNLGLRASELGFWTLDLRAPVTPPSAPRLRPRFFLPFFLGASFIFVAFLAVLFPAVAFLFTFLAGRFFLAAFLLTDTLFLAIFRVAVLFAAGFLASFFLAVFFATVFLVFLLLAVFFAAVLAPARAEVRVRRPAVLSSSAACAAASRAMGTRKGLQET